MTKINQHKIGEQNYIISKLPLREAFNLRRALLKCYTKCANNGEEMKVGLFFSTLIDDVVDFDLVLSTVKASLFSGSNAISDSAIKRMDAGDLFDVFIKIAKGNFKDTLTQKKSGIEEQIMGLASIITPDTQSSEDLSEE